MRVAVIFYSLTGSVTGLARSVAQGAEAAGADVRLRRVEDLPIEGPLSPQAQQARRELAEIPIATHQDLRWCQGVAFGSPTRFGNMAAPLKQFIDGCGALWLKGELVGKLAAVFTATGAQHGGQESTLLSMMLPLFHLGFFVMGLPYAEQRQMSVISVQGGSPYGASAVTGLAGERLPTDGDLALARALGRRLADAAERLSAGPPLL